MRLSSLTDYAVVMMAAAARHGPEARLTATALAEETGVPLPTAQKLMGRLAAAGLLTSARGTGGGFRLARASAEISLADIVEAVEGPIALTACAENGRHDCALETACQVRPHMSAASGAVRNALVKITLAELSSTACPEPVEACPEPAAAGGSRRGLSSSFVRKQGQGFDKLSLSGESKQTRTLA